MGDPFFDGHGEVILPNLSNRISQQSRNLCNFSWAFATLSVHDEKLLTTLSREAEERVFVVLASCFSPQESFLKRDLDHSSQMPNKSMGTSNDLFLSISELGKYIVTPV